MIVEVVTIVEGMSGLIVGLLAISLVLTLVDFIIDRIREAVDGR